MEKWIWSVWDTKMIQKHEQYNPEHKNKGLQVGITILEFCYLIVERKKISGIIGVCGVGYLVQGLEEIENEVSSEQFVKIKLFVKITGSQPISVQIERFDDILSQSSHFEYFWLG